VVKGGDKWGKMDDPHCNMDASSPPERFYAGEFRHSIDEKNRITIPSRWRRDKAEDFIVLPEASQQFLLVMSPDEFARMSSVAESSETVPARDRRVFLRQLHCLARRTLQKGWIKR